MAPTNVNQRAASRWGGIELKMHPMRASHDVPVGANLGAKSPTSVRQDALANAADLAVELYALSVQHGYEELSARFLDAAGEARRLRAACQPSLGRANAAAPNAT